MTCNGSGFFLSSVLAGIILQKSFERQSLVQIRPVFSVSKIVDFHVLRFLEFNYIVIIKNSFTISVSHMNTNW